jgi:diaminopimelate decarboxylase
MLVVVLALVIDHPNREPIPDFKSYFDTYSRLLKLEQYQTLHFELGRSVVAQCGSLITKDPICEARNKETVLNCGCRNDRFDSSCIVSCFS